MPGNLPPYSKNLTALAHNWGFLTGAAVLREQPDLFDRLVILNVNSLPDGELTPSRFPNLALACTGWSKIIPACLNFPPFSYPPT